MLWFVNDRQPRHSSAVFRGADEQKMPEPFRVLITGGGSTTAISALKGLRMGNDPTIRIVVGDMSPDCAGAYLADAFVQLPSASRPDFREEAIRICRDHRIDLVIPIIDHEFAGWSDVRADLAASGTQVAVSSRAALEQCQEKDRTYELFRRLDVPTIPTRRGAEVDDPTKLEYPVFLKPRCGRASLDNYRADSPEEFRLFLPKVPDPIVQPFAEGMEVTIDCLNDLDGRFLAACPRYRQQVRSGQAVRSKTFRDAHLEGLARRIAEALPIVGPCNMQCFLTPQGPVFFEINARFGAGSVLSMHAGLNGPLALVALARKRPLPPLEPRGDVAMVRYWQEAFIEDGRVTHGGPA